MKDFFRKREYEANTETVSRLQREFGIDEPTAVLCAARGYENRLSGGKQTLSDPFLIDGMDEACETIEELIAAGGSVMIYGDYDADGISAASVLKLYFDSLGVSAVVVLPRRENGYGLHADLVGEKLEEFPCDLLITVDCGISDKEEIERIRDEYGLEVIVTDHHELPPILPDCVCVNCKKGGGYPYLSGSGVAFKLVQALSGEEAANKYASLAAVGIIGDLMPLEDENRIIVERGLSEINHAGLRSLLKIAGVNGKCNVYDYTMKICPRINAAGRVGDPYPALEVLLAMNKADDFAAIRLNELNETRKKLLEETISESDGMITAESLEKDRCVFVVGEGWKHGILGIAASRYKEKYGLSAFVMMKEDGKIVGSGRGTVNVNLFAIFSEMSDVFVRFGGHRHSVGFTLAEEKLGEFRERLSDALGKQEFSDYCIYYDLDYKPEYSSAEFREFTDRLQPMATSDVPVFRIRDYCDEVSLFGQSRDHVAFKLHSGFTLKGFFSYSGYVYPAERRNLLDFLFTMEYDSFEKKTIGIIRAMTPCNSLRIDELCLENLAASLRPTGEILSDSSDESGFSSDKPSSAKSDCSGKAERLFEIVDSDGAKELIAAENVTVVAFSLGEAAKIVRKEGFCLTDFRPEYFTPSTFAGKRLLVAPTEVPRAERAGSLLFVLGSRDYLKIGYPFPKGSRVFVSDCGSFIPRHSGLTREICGRVYKALRSGKKRYSDWNELWTTLPLYDLTRGQITLAIKVFEELELIRLCEPIEITFTEKKKAELNASTIFSAINQKNNGENDANRTG